ncbi:helix-turn-helix domain-containing protein [Nonomuraea sp. CA-143628]|uniref:helix-turn-helix domain-containing protein n=1 Tax=Nonomuraea sp. CA-143628 TaxID=3239997 RepID=UPI003D940131
MPTPRGSGDSTEISGDTWQRSGPTALRMLVGVRLRRLRESHGITRGEAGSAIGCSASRITSLEGGRIGLPLGDVADLLSLYGVDEDERQIVLALAVQANAPGRWQDYRDVIPDEFEAFLGLEQDATVIRTYEDQHVPALLQTKDYARAVIAQSHEGGDAELIERRVALRMHRQRLLLPPTPRTLWVVMDESVLRRQVGDSATMRAQMEHLHEMVKLPHVTLQVLPFVHGKGVDPFTVLRFAEADLPDVVHLEQTADAQYLTRDADVRPYRHLLNQLSVYAQPAGATPEILQQIIGTLWSAS